MTMLKRQNIFKDGAMSYRMDPVSDAEPKADVPLEECLS
jgi:hypothetical protein